MSARDEVVAGLGCAVIGAALVAYVALLKLVLVMTHYFARMTPP